MNYPVWIMPVIGGGWVIGIIAIIHIFVSHFAVGGGAFLAVTEHMAYKHDDDRIYQYLKRHSRFFLLVTTVLGVIFGPGIWWSISLVSPNATETLIQNYTLLWAFEYVVFATELATFFVYYYTWGRIPRKQHLKLAWLYFGISILTLVTINGMLTFMLTPGRWLQTHSWLDGYFNPSYWPSNFLRVLIMMGIAGMYALITSSLIKDLDFRTKMLRYSAKWLLPIFFVGPIIGFWYFTTVPQAAIQTIFTGVHTTGLGAFSILARALYLSLILSGTILVFAFVGPYLNPRGFSFRTALIFLAFGLIVTGVSEWTRELLRKPYVIYNYMYSNSLLRDQVPEINQKGYLMTAAWAAASLPPNPTPWQKGRAIFQNQCMSCHTVHGYRGMDRFLDGRDRNGIQNFLSSLRETDPKKNPYSGIMPPLVGHDDEIAALGLYLSTINARQASQASPGIRKKPGTSSKASAQ
jgi:cytochrome d ubiquinol oxidase subunit I